MQKEYKWNIEKMVRKEKKKKKKDKGKIISLIICS